MIYNVIFRYFIIVLHLLIFVISMYYNLCRKVIKSIQHIPSQFNVHFTPAYNLFEFTVQIHKFKKLILYSKTGLKRLSFLFCWYKYTSLFFYVVGCIKKRCGSRAVCADLDSGKYKIQTDKRTLGLFQPVLLKSAS